MDMLCLFSKDPDSAFAALRKRPKRKVKEYMTARDMKTRPITDTDDIEKPRANESRQI